MFFFLYIGRLRLKEPKNFIDFSVKILSKAFKHDVYSSQSISSEVADMSTSVSYNSNCMGLMSELYRFLARCTLLSETVTNLEAGRNLNLWKNQTFELLFTKYSIFDIFRDTEPRYQAPHSHTYDLWGVGILYHRSEYQASQIKQVSMCQRI